MFFSKKRYFYWLVLGVFFSGCSINYGFYAKLDDTKQRDLKTNTMGQSCVHNILGIIPIGSLSNRVAKATNKAIEKANKKGIQGSILTNAVVYNYNKHWFLGIVNTNCTVVEGNLRF
ncbi:TRL domain-containing protein [Helicobacter cetorum]|uniref:TRL domain-containing protein n=1 Tax=Helicobacter cetorum TaxID=138563 RepID=UPI001315A2D5|nr:TRL domain-containing protein [Helicobacter cetorum]